MERLYAEHKERGFELLLVNIGEPEDRVRAAVKARGYRARVLLDTQGEVSRAYGVRGTPTAFLIDREGQIVGRAIGMRDWAGPKGRAVLAGLLAVPR